MKVEHYTDTPARPVEGVPGVTVRWVISKADNSPNFAMRVFEVQPGYSSPYHQHDFEHEVFILAGEGVLRRADGESPIGPGTIALVPNMEMHQFVNRGEGVLRFICLVPNNSY